MKKKKNKFPKRKRRFNLLTEEGRYLQMMYIKIKDAIPDPSKRLEYIRALITEFTEKIPEQTN